MTKLPARFTFLLLCLFCSVSSFAQQTEKPEMADVMRSNGKIYVVVVVCLTILIGLFLYVANVDRKIKRIEKGN